MATATCSLSLAASVAAAEKPNIIYILADDLGYGDVGFLGQTKIKTPCLDKLAKESLVFSRHYAGAAVCGPSRACLLTGMSQSIGFIKNNPGQDWRRENLRDEDITIAEKLKEAGYDTACIGKWGLGPQGKSGYPTNQGFDHFIGYDTHVAAHNYYPKTLCSNGGRMPLPKNAKRSASLSEKTYSHDVLTKEALTWIDARRSKPWFMYLAYTIPHGPYNPPDLGPYKGTDWKPLEKKYAAMITRMDRDIGRILELIRKKGQEKNTIVMFSSDNGTSYPGVKPGMAPGNDFFRSSGPLRGRKRDMYDGGVHVPFTARWPGKVKPGTTDHVSGFQDLMPTICELLSLTVPRGCDGISFLPTLMGKALAQKKHEFLYWEFLRMTKEGGSLPVQGILDVKRNLKGANTGIGSHTALYDLSVDTAEKTDISSQRPEIAAELAKQMETMRSESELWPKRWLSHTNRNTGKKAKKGRKTSD